jgi:tetratricopeptide (TPR) repeat protein
MKQPTITRSGILRMCGIGAVIGAALIAGCRSSAPRIDRTVDLGFPSPLSGPGQPPLNDDAEDAVFAAWALLTTGQTAEARLRAAAAGSSDPAALVTQQVALLDGSPSIDQLTAITQRTPAYAAAWATLSVAAERVGDEALAMEAAHRVAALWSSSPWSGRADALEQRWIDDRVEGADQAVNSGDAEAAIELVQRALDLRPDHRRALLVLGGAERTRGDLEAADAAFARLGDDPEALLERADIARVQDRPSAAMDLLARLPDDHPQRDAALRRARLEWRLTVMPARVQEALEAPTVTRANLAVLLVSLAPDLDSQGGAPPPLMTDVVDHPAQREILTAVRLGLLGPDPVDGRFHPDAEAYPHQVRDAITTACRIVGYREPLWCDEDMSVESDCQRLATPVSGAAVKRVVLDQAGARP